MTERSTASVTVVPKAYDLVHWLFVFCIVLFESLAARSARADVGSGVSPAFVLYLGPGFEEPPGSGVGSANSAAFSLYLGPGFEATPGGGVGSAISPAFALWLGRLSEGGASSPAIVLDTRSADPSFVAAPDSLEATAIACTDLVRLSWADNSSDETGFEIQSKPAGLDATWYTRLDIRPAGTTAYTYSPGDGLPHTYRVRAIRVLAFSEYSNEVSVRTDGMNGSPSPPARFTVKSVGDARTMRVHLWPPQGAADWTGVTRLEIYQYADDLEHFVNMIPRTLPHGAPPEQTVDFVGELGTGYYFRARCVNGCGQSSSDVTAGPINPRHAPIIFAHGIWSDGGAWGSVWSNGLQARGYEAQRWHAITFSASGGSWVDWASELKEAVGTYLANDWATDERVDIVAHSQGGLAARQFIEVLESGRDQVRNLVMLGTPNHGGRGSTLVWLEKVAAKKLGIPSDPRGVKDLITNSRHLRELNFGNSSTKDGICKDSPDEIVLERKGSVMYYTLAGTGPSALSCAPPAGLLDRRCWLDSALEEGDVGSCAGDGVVPFKSVQLRRIEPQDQWLDSEVCQLPTGLVHTSFWGLLPLPGSSVSMLESKTVVDFVMDLLIDGNACREAHAPARIEDASTGGGSDMPELTYSLITSVVDSLPSGGVRRYAAPVDSTTGVAVFASWQDSSVAIRLIAPDSTSYSPGDSVFTPGLHYEQDDVLGYAALAMDNPLPGIWQVEVNAVNGPGLAHYTIYWVVADGGLRLAGTVTPDVVDPGQTVILTANLRQGDRRLAATCGAIVRTPSGTFGPITLVDDGTSGDSTAADGTYTGTFVAPSENGACTATITAQTALPGGNATSRVIDRPLSIVKLPDLRLTAADVHWAPLLASVARDAELRATIRNIGNASADTAEVVFQDLSSATIVGRVRLAIPAGDTVTARILWVPGIRGEHQVTVRVDRIGGTERDLTNNSADVIVPVAGPTPVTAVGEPETAPPVRAWLAAPFPNPSRSQVVLNFELARAGSVTLRVFDLQGRLIRSLSQESLPPGRYTRVWNGTSEAGTRVGSGLYFIQMIAPDLRQSRKVVLIR